MEGNTEISRRSGHRRRQRNGGNGGGNGGGGGSGNCSGSGSGSGGGGGGGGGVGISTERRTMSTSSNTPTTDRRKPSASEIKQATSTASNTPKVTTSKFNVKAAASLSMSSSSAAGTTATTAAAAAQPTPTPTWQKYRKDITDPEFCDATTSISATTFGARRLPEIKDLWMATITATKHSITSDSYGISDNTNTTTVASAVTTNILKKNHIKKHETANKNSNGIATGNTLIRSYKSSGRKTSCRHLRKRTRSYKPRQRYRTMIFINNDDDNTKNKRKNNNDYNTNVNDAIIGMKQQQQQEQKQELQDCSQIQPNDDNKKGNQQDSSDPYHTATGSCTSTETTRSLSRRKRRKDPLMLRQNHDAWRNRRIKTRKLIKDQEESRLKKSSVNTNTNNCNSRSNNNWMMTHLWHTKRFHMVQLWGWCIPILHTNRGTQASLRLVCQATTNKKRLRGDKYDSSNEIYRIEDDNVSIIPTANNNNSYGEVDNFHHNSDIPPPVAVQCNDGIKCLLHDATWCMQPVWFQLPSVSGAVVSACQELVRQFIPNFTIVESMSTGMNTTGSNTTNTIRTNNEHYHNDDGDTVERSNKKRSSLGVCNCSKNYDENDNAFSVDWNNSNNNGARGKGVGGEGIFHSKCQFPAGAIGPIAWLCTNRSFGDHTITTCSVVRHDDDDDDDDDDANDMIRADCHTTGTAPTTTATTIFVYFWVHPSIKDIVHSMLDGAIQSYNSSYINDIPDEGQKLGHDSCTTTPLQPELARPHMGVHGGIACLKLRGCHAAECLARVLAQLPSSSVRHESKHTTGNENNNTNCDSNTNSIEIIEQSSSSSKRIAASFLNWTRTARHEGKISGPNHLSTWFPPAQEQREQGVSWLSSSSSSSFTAFGGVYCIQCIQPRDLTNGNRHNYAVCGYDIHTNPNIAKELFIKLVLNEVACPIGYADEAYLALECEPPMLMFPRDYPDTPEGELYWSRAQSPWNTIRTYWEGGGGRVRTQASINISNVVHKNEVASTSSCPILLLIHNMQNEIDPLLLKEEVCAPGVVVVRAELGSPFEHALNGLAAPLPLNGNVIPSCSIVPRSKKRRRPTTQHQHCVVHAPRLSKDQILTQTTVIETLWKSLSLPAVLLCHVQVIGKGRLQALDTIQSYCSYPEGDDGDDDDDDNHSPTTTTTTASSGDGDGANNRIQMGFISTGYFSPARGRFHGIGIISASRFLETLAATTTISITRNTNLSCTITDTTYTTKTSFHGGGTTILIGRDLSGIQSIRIKVLICHKGCSYFVACLKLLL